MHSTMPDAPLTTARILRYATTVHASSQVATWNGEGLDTRSYAEVGERAARLAHALRDRLGTRTDEQSVIGTLMWNNARHLELFAAVPAMGSVLHTVNWRMPADQMTHTIAHAGDEVLVVDADLLEPLAPVLARLPDTVRHVVVAGPGDHEALSGFTGGVHDYEELITGLPGDHPWQDRLDEHSAAMICYTTGTTGKPKGVVYSHRSIFLHCYQVLSPSHYGISPHDTLFPVVPMYHAGGWCIPHAAFFTGAGLLLPDRFTGAAPLARMIDRGRPTFSAAVPTVWSSLLPELDTRAHDTASLTRVYVGGSACPPALIAAYRDRHAIELLHGWGMTETMGLVSAAVPPRGADADEEWAYRLSQGRFPPSVEFRLVDPDGAPVPHDGVATGELHLRGPDVTCAYHGEGAPEEHFTADGWLRTGDVGSISPDGYLRLTDRVKDVIKSGGESISSVRLENALMEHAAVAEAAVIAVPDDRWGERPLAAVSLRHNGTDPAELRDFLAERLDAWMVPERWAVLPAVPKTSVGKYDKGAIRDQYAHGLLPVVRLDRHHGARADTGRPGLVNG
ncbi:long-chain-fatty-acid--CoA ligase [Saccharothrix obliqua]|uniref:long-chain-fatty-acid--CoA ligase n=1 Tax=Saccharothrix obliqua TaxID=2861747 RepID=UPI001C5DB5A8|nr:long-chain-fatty-acid--CoA ligase [Saccharothrix obliqua]MBW4717224.1 long-chain-fatty-acid--CoA ligase [Saccharothrix obliqua]